MKILEEPIEKKILLDSRKVDQAIKNQELYQYWKKQSLPFQIANIGSEVSRSLKNRENPNRFRAAYERALELFDLTITSETERGHDAGVEEVSLAKAEFCDYFDKNSLRTDPEKMMRYYDQFAMLIRN